MGQNNEFILDLLFDLATWHAFAKLRLHTEAILDLFEKVTIYLGDSMHKFQQMTCVHYWITELLQEHVTCGRHTAALAVK